MLILDWVKSLAEQKDINVQEKTKRINSIKEFVLDVTQRQFETFEYMFENEEMSIFGTLTNSSNESFSSFIIPLEIRNERNEIVKKITVDIYDWKKGETKNISKSFICNCSPKLNCLVQEIEIELSNNDSTEVLKGKDNTNFSNKKNFSIYCGSPIVEGANYCGNCGKKIL